jgi:hypothetical protein
MWTTLAEIFADGDVLYGLDEGRGAAKRAILDHRRTVEKQAITFCFFKTTKQFERIIIQNDITNSVFDPNAAGLRTDGQIKKTNAVKSDPQRAIGFRDFVANHPKYALANYQPTGDMNDMRAAWLKTSKAGLEFQAKRRNGFKIHFILDGLGYDRVLAQDSVKDTLAGTRIRTPLDITSGEVRWLFRHRNAPSVMDAVVFWYEGQEKPAPWLWAENRIKFANFLYTKDQMLTDDQAGQFRDAITELKGALMAQRAFRKRKGKYAVRPGDSLKWIAIKHSVSVQDLMNWNKLADDKVEPGQLLVVARIAPPQGQVVGNLVSFWENVAKSRQ